MNKLILMALLGISLHANAVLPNGTMCSDAKGNAREITGFANGVYSFKKYGAQMRFLGTGTSGRSGLKNCDTFSSLDQENETMTTELQNPVVEPSTGADAAG